jgi:hypothetical protein
LIVVVGAEALRLMLVVRRMQCRARIVANPGWKRGIATSLRAGLGAVPRRAQAALVMLVDQPRIDAAALQRLVAAWRRRPGVPAAARYAGRAACQPCCRVATGTRYALCAATRAHARCCGIAAVRSSRCPRRRSTSYKDLLLAVTKERLDHRRELTCPAPTA